MIMTEFELNWMFHTGIVTCFFSPSQHLSVHYCLGAMLGPCLDFDWPVSWPSDQTHSWSLASSGLVGQKSSPSARALGHGHWSGQSSSAGYRGKTLFFLSIYVYPWQVIINMSLFLCFWQLSPFCLKSFLCFDTVSNAMITSCLQTVGQEPLKLWHR